MITFDGHDLEALAYVGDPSFEIANTEPVYMDAPGKDGAYVAGATLGVSSVSFNVSIFGELPVRRDKLSTLSMWLNVDEPKKLVLPDTVDRYYMAVPDGGLSLTRAVDADLGRLTFNIVDPAAFGEVRTVNIPSAGETTFIVGGTYPTKPIITAAAAIRNSGTQTWGVRHDNADYGRVNLPSASAASVEIDCSKRTATVANAVAIPTLDSDWFTLEPGEHTIRNDYGSGASVVAFTERWL